MYKVLKPMLIRRIVLCCIFAMGSVCAFGQSSSTEPAKSQPSTPAQPTTAAPAGADTSAFDTAVDPCKDFYAYVCNPWKKENPLPADQSSWSGFDELELRNDKKLRDILDNAQKESPQRSAIEQKIGDYYAACMDEKSIEDRAMRVLDAEFERIGNLSSKSELAAEIGHIHLITFNLDPSSDSGATTALFGFTSGQDLDDATKVVATVDQGGISLPDREYYLKTDPESVGLVNRFLTHVIRTLMITGEPGVRANPDGKAVVGIETDLAKASMDIVKRRDPANLNHKLSLAQLQALTPSFNWDDYLKTIGAPPSDHYLVASPEFLQAMDAELKKISLQDWKTYLRWQLVRASAPLMYDIMYREYWHFFNHTLLGEKKPRERWRRCVARTDIDLGEALGQAYVQNNFSPESKEKTLALIQSIENALATDIQQIDWMTPATKKQAEAKLHAIAKNIGYPDHWRDYSAFTVKRDDFVGNAFRGGEFELHRQLAKIGKPVDRNEWLMTPPTVNAYYNPQVNSINFPAGILQPPFFRPKSDDAVNLGAIGAVMGHEITHGFDDEGRKYDAAGNVHDWWTAEDGKQFVTRAKCIEDEYSSFTPIPDVNLNGGLTLGENTADAGGLRLAYMALTDMLSKNGKADEKVDGYTPLQRFFFSYAKTYCANETPQLMRLNAASNPHSPPKFRVNGVLSNMPEFEKAFGCKAGQEMVRAPACRVW